MKNKLVFRILGALASALIIASVFIPFVSVTGYSQSLWQTHSAVGTIYLPIMIIVFGVVGVLVFSTGFKTELAYASAGGLLFFLIMQTIPVIDQSLFNTLGVGYYCLVIGTLLIAVMALICGLKVKQKAVEQVVVEEKKEESMIDQIDKLYNDQAVTPTINDNNSLDNIIQPLPSNMPVSIPVENNMPSSIPVENDIVESQNLQIEALNEVVEEIQPVPAFNNLEPNVNVEEQIINPVISEFDASGINVSNKPEESNPVLQQFNPAVSKFSTSETNTSDEVEKTNSVVPEFNTPVMNDAPESNDVASQHNPVMSEFTNSFAEQSMFVSNNNENLNQTNEATSIAQTNITSDSIIQPLNSDRKIDVMGDTTNTSSDLDIFG